MGARPQFIKAAVVSRAFQERADSISEAIIHTGQHFDANMSSVFFDELGIPVPKHNLGIGGGSHGQNTGRMLEKIETVLLEEKPDWVLVYGDTDSTLAGALAAVKIHIPVAHVEAGLRSFNRAMPEEINRILTDHASSQLFTPTDSATAQLKVEGIDDAKVHQVGDVMFDAAIYYGERALATSKIMLDLALEPKGFILATVHRAENTDDRVRLSAILNAFGASPIPVVWPIHPRTRKRIADFDLTLPDRIDIVDPVGYLDMVMLQKNARIIATDSGGVQKEAYFHGVPCVTLRDETEWTELIDIGANRLVGADASQITALLQTTSLDLADTSARPYGDGHASEDIVHALRR